MDVHLQEHQWCVHSRLHYQFLLQRMFVHAEALGQMEYDHAICQGRWQPSAKQDMKAAPSAVEVISPDSTREEISQIYHDVYQLQRLPGKSPCDEEMEECLCQEILDSIKECLQHKQVPHCQGRDRVSTPLAPLGATPRLTTVPGSIPPTTSSGIWSKTPVRKHWP